MASSLCYCIRANAGLLGLCLVLSGWVCAKAKGLGKVFESGVFASGLDL